MKTAEEDGPVIESVAIDERDVQQCKKVFKEKFRKVSEISSVETKRKKLKKIS